MDMLLLKASAWAADPKVACTSQYDQSMYAGKLQCCVACKQLSAQQGLLTPYSKQTGRSAASLRRLSCMSLHAPARPVQKLYEPFDSHIARMNRHLSAGTKQ